MLFLGGNMPPTTRISKEDIIDAAVEIVRTEGAAALNARAIAARLKSSTQPIFSNFSSMEELKSSVIEEANKLYLTKENELIEKKLYPPYKSTGMAYIRFAKEEKELFKLLFMRDRTNEPMALGYRVDPALEILISSTGFDLNTAERVHLSLWACVHGFATMSVSNYVDIPDEIISSTITDIYTSLTSKIKESDEKNEKDHRN